MTIPHQLLRQLYNFGSLRNVPGGVEFVLKNRLLDVTLTGVRTLRIDGRDVSLPGVSLRFEGAAPRSALPFGAPLLLPVRTQVHVHVDAMNLGKGSHTLLLEVEAQALGTLSIEAEDVLASDEVLPEEPHIPRRDADDFGERQDSCRLKATRSDAPLWA